MQNTLKKLSNREMFKQLLLNDVLNIIEDFGGTYIALTDLREELRTGKKASADFYLNNMYSKRWTFTSWDDRFYRAIKSIANNKDVTVKKLNGRLYAFADISTDFKASLLNMGATEWTANYTGHSK
jgi:hypothetical protein